MRLCYIPCTVFNSDNIEESRKEKESVKSIVKQVLICSTVWTQFFMAGLAAGAPTVFIPQLRKEGIPIDNELGSWLYSMSSFGTLPWTIIMPIFTKLAGRKLPEIVTSVATGASFLLLCFSSKPYQIIIAELLQGCLFADNVTVTILIVIEYCSPKYRGLFLTIKSASFFWGIWVANAMGTFYHWKSIAVLGVICNLYTFNVLFWPESPFWLASKGRFDECKAAFRSIHGVNDESERDLSELISAEDERIRSSKDAKPVGYREMFASRELHGPLILSLVAVMQYQFSGKIIYSFYILDIFKKITSVESSAYTAMLVLDGVTVLGMYVGSFMSKRLRRRTLYMMCSFTGVAFLLILSLYLYLIRLTVIVENKYVTLSLLTMYSMSISCGPMILALSVCGEIVPTRYQAPCYIIISLVFTAFYTLLIKLSPVIFSSFGVDGTFLFYGVTCGLCTVYLYMYLPETKNKTQQQIELFFKKKRKDGAAPTENELRAV